MQKLLIVLFGAALCIPFPGEAQVFNWSDVNGVTNYSNRFYVAQNGKGKGSSWNNGKRLKSDSTTTSSDSSTTTSVSGSTTSDTGTTTTTTTTTTTDTSGGTTSSSDGSTSGSTTTAAPTPSFYGDWESGTVTGRGDRNWRNSELVAPDRFSILTGPEARQGIKYARVIVRPGDNPLTWCCNGSERAEVVYMQDSNDRIVNENENSGVVQYAFSVKFDPTWQTIVSTGNGAWGMFLQLHGPTDVHPAFALVATDRIYFRTRFGDVSSNFSFKGPDKAYALSNASLNKGRWIDLIITVKYASTPTGFITVARRDEGQTSFTEVLNLTNTITLQWDSQKNGGAIGGHYMKTGLYRNAQPFTSILYLDGFTRTVLSSGP